MTAEEIAKKGVEWRHSTVHIVNKYQNDRNLKNLRLLKSEIKKKLSFKFESYNEFVS